jgi:4-hydroxybenzoate polyprenyltransferase/phosphoserine phosphatase
MKATAKRKLKSGADLPLVVDLDGTLLKVDSLHEAFVQLLAKKPLQALRALSLLNSRAAFKSAVADHVSIDAATIPLDSKVLAFIEKAREGGRKVYLATAADKRFAEAIADSTGAFDGVFASENGINLKGKAKADRLVAAFGARGFDYIGNAAADLPIWRAARNVLFARAPLHVIGRIKRDRPDSVEVAARDSKARALLLAMRPHQWIKNSLLFLPALAAHNFSASALLTILIAFFSFSFGASSIYLVNDMIDLPHDRAHIEKRHRPLAAGSITVRDAAILFVLLAGISIGLALMLPASFMLVLAGYLCLAMSYSFYLKRKLMVDVVALAALYGIRVVAGSAATGIFLSQWLAGFCFFIFLSLALMKRTTEIILLPKSSEDKIKGRGYRRADFPTINALTAASGFVAVLVLALYINSPDVKILYQRPDMLWGICIILVYWLGRAFFLTGRGEMRQDPVIFAATDWRSLLAGVLILATFIVAL